MPTRKQLSETRLINSMLALSIVLAGYFLQNILQLVQNVKLHDIVGAPSTYAAVPSGALAAYILLRSSQIRSKYVAVVILTILTVGLLIWFFGITAAGTFFSSKS